MLTFFDGKSEPPILVGPTRPLERAPLNPPLDKQCLITLVKILENCLVRERERKRGFMIKLSF